ncbi:MAG TPA: hypothetical protein VKH35_03865 [Thermoanaerobaculia bacterium]|nr:hypothetical protein [Thermoanaerobaculia bacterium]
MTKPALTLTLVLLAAMPLAAQNTSEFGLMIGGSKRLISRSDQAAGIGVSDNFRFSNSDREAFYGVQVDPGTFFKVQIGQIEGPLAFQYTTPEGATARTDIRKGTLEHVSGTIDYRFSEAFGSTGLFAGVGLYRQHGSVTDTAVPDAQRGNESETNYGFVGGVNADFPITRRTGFIAELAYHWVNFHYKVRYLTLGGGLRFSF